MNKCFLFLMITALTTVAVAQESDPLSVMSFNIRYDNPNDPFPWENRKGHVSDVISKIHKADSAGLQEVVLNQLQDLKARMKDYKHIGVGRDDGQQGGEFCPIFYDSNRLELLDSDTFWLSKTPETPGSRSWSSACNRICTWGKFRDKKTNKVFYHFNTHFDHRSWTAREESAKLIWQRIQIIAKDAPVVLTGDFNSYEDSLPIQILLGQKKETDVVSHLKNTKTISREKPTGPKATFSDWKKVRAGKGPIDYIFVRNGFAVLEHHTIDDQFEGYFPSDHLPLLSVLQFQ